MAFIGYIILGIIIAILLIVYILFLLTYLSTSKKYKAASKVNGQITDDLGPVKKAVGGVAIGVPRYRVFHKYRVSFYLNGKEYSEEAELKDSYLNIGDSVELRYDISKEGEIKLRSEAFLYWSKEMAIGYTIGLLLGIVLSILKANDLI